MIRVHGTSVALGGDGILLRGPSGSGKSDLALRLIDEGGRLIADDQTELRLSGSNDVFMTAPATIAGRMEVRGIGILRVPAVATAPLRLVVDLVPSAAVERLPDHQTYDYLDCRFPLIQLAAFEASAPAKLRLALRALGPATPRTIMVAT